MKSELKELGEKMQYGDEDEIVVHEKNWKKDIAMELINVFGDYSNKNFIDLIWDISQLGFDSPREVQVIIDSNMITFCSVGSVSFVSFDGQEDELTKGKRLTLPLKCWLHTHPFGRAYFSGTDQKTVNTWRLFLEDAIVIGNNETARINLKEGYSQITHYGYAGDEEE